MNDVDWLREVLGPLDPAAATDDAVVVAPARPQRSWARRAAPLLVAAAVAVLAGTVVASLPAWDASVSPGSPGGPSPVVPTPTASPGPVVATPTARSSYDHVRWTTWQGQTVVETTERWFNGVDGRVVLRDARGAVTQSYALRLPGSAIGAEDPPVTVTAGPLPSGIPSPQPSTASDVGVFPGPVPTDPTDMRTFLAAEGSEDPADLARNAATLVLTRHLDQQQADALARTVASLELATQPGRAPDGSTVRLALVTDDGSTRSVLVLTQDGRLRGVADTDASTATTTWQVVTSTSLTRTPGE